MVFGILLGTDESTYLAAVGVPFASFVLSHTARLYNWHPEYTFARNSHPRKRRFFVLRSHALKVHRCYVLQAFDLRWKDISIDLSYTPNLLANLSPLYLNYLLELSINH